MRALFCAALLLGAAFTFGQSTSPLPRRATLGVGLRAVPAELQAKHKLAPQSAVQVTGPSLPGDLKEGDIVLEIAGKPFTSFGAMNDIIRDLKAGEKVSLKVLDAAGQTVTRTVPAVERPREKSDKYDVVYDHVVSSGNRIRTILTRPKAAGKYPVYFWIQGINAGTVDYPLTSPNAVAKAIRPFAEDGFVTLRVEKTGVGDSEGGPALQVAFNEEVDIYRQALKTLEKYDFVDRNRVYIFGHSMGGCHAPIVASEFPVKGIVTYGTVSESWLEWEIKAARSQGLLAGGDPVEIDKRVRKLVTFYSALYNDKKSVDQIRQERPDLSDFIKETVRDGEMLSARSVKYMVELNDHNFSQHWSKIGNAKVLALFGEHDFVALEGDQTQIPLIVNRTKPGQATFQRVKESDHGFTKTTSFEDSLKKWGQPGAEFNPEVVRVVREWIATQEK
jgi:dienelactone hydrolase